jgi:hypothetical protein
MLKYHIINTQGTKNASSLPIGKAKNIKPSYTDYGEAKKDLDELNKYSNLKFMISYIDPDRFRKD